MKNCHVCCVVQSYISCFLVERNWKAGQPDNWNHGHGPGEDCAGLIYAGFWNDFYCEDVNNFICEKDMDKGKQGAWFDYFTLTGQIQVNFPQLWGRRLRHKARCYGSASLRKRRNHTWSTSTQMQPNMGFSNTLHDVDAGFIVITLVLLCSFTTRPAFKVVVGIACSASWPSPADFKHAWHFKHNLAHVLQTLAAPKAGFISSVAMLGGKLVLGWLRDQPLKSKRTILRVCATGGTWWLLRRS